MRVFQVRYFSFTSTNIIHVSSFCKFFSEKITFIVKFSLFRSSWRPYRPQDLT